MVDRVVQLVLQYDGAHFAGWQRQSTVRTVQGELERVFGRLVGRAVSVIGAGRTDSGVHARGQAAHVVVPESWVPERLRRAANALLPDDIWVAAACTMDNHFHARYSALSRCYSYHIGTDEMADSPFRRRYEWRVSGHKLDEEVLHQTAAMIVGEHTFRGFAVRGTAPATDHHRCVVLSAEWKVRKGGYVFIIEANRFLHHMVRFLVGTMLDAASGRRTLGSFADLLTAGDNSGVSPPAPPHALFLDRVTYPETLYCK